MEMLRHWNQLICWKKHDTLIPPTLFQIAQIAICTFIQFHLQFCNKFYYFQWIWEKASMMF